MTGEEAVEYFHSVSWLGSRPGLERISELCCRMGDPQKRLRFIHVAGTNGKGSVCAMLTQMLISAGHRVGSFCSPYIVDFRERICVNGEMISCELLARSAEAVRVCAGAMSQSPTEFELVTAAAFYAFDREKCDIVILEAGMGGRLDCTNIIEAPEVSVITGIALDHTEYLGDTTEKIAREKAGIIKHGCPVVLGEADDAAAEVIRRRAAELGAPLCITDYGSLTDIHVSLDGCRFNFEKLSCLETPLVGAYQPRNAAVAITCARILGLDGETIRAGLASVHWRARFEVISGEPAVIFDGGHNVQGVRSVVETLTALGIERVVLFSAVMADKQYTEMAKILAPFVEAVYCTSPAGNARALAPEKYAAVFGALGVRSYSAETAKEALTAALDEARRQNLPLLAAGSLYIYGEFITAARALLCDTECN